jgi:hypothetical protein
MREEAYNKMREGPNDQVVKVREEQVDLEPVLLVNCRVAK